MRGLDGDIKRRLHGFFVLERSTKTLI